MLHLNIPQPCHEKWEDMSPTERGAYCQSCCKEVTDFTGMKDKEIAKYFLERKDQPVCGRLLNTQLNRPLLYISPGVLQMNIPYWKKFLAALFICFSSLLVSCDNKTSADSIMEWEYVEQPAVAKPVVTPVIENKPVTEYKQVIAETPKKASKKKSRKKNKQSTEVVIYESIIITGYVQPEFYKKPVPANNGPIWDAWAEYPGKYPHFFNNE